MEVKVTIIPAKHWYDYVKFRTEEEVCIAGVTVPKGFVSDGASVPRWLTLIGLVILLITVQFNIIFGSLFGVILAIAPVVFPKLNMYFAAALVHDYCITEKKCSRKQADKIFKQSLKQLNIKPWRYSIMYAVVRIWGVLKG